MQAEGTRGRKGHIMSTRTTKPGHPISRRTVLKSAAVTAAGASALTTAIAQASTGSPGFYVNLRQDKGEVITYNFYQPWIDQIAPMFEEETGIKVNQMGAYSSNDEWWARLNAGEAFDFFIPTTDWLQRAMAADLVDALDYELLPNISNLYADWQKNEVYQKDGEQYAVPFARVYYSLTYNTNEFSEAPTSWDVTWDEAYKGKITMQDQAYARVGTTALLLGDDPLNPQMWDEIKEKLLEQKDLVSKYWTDYQNGMELFVNEEVVVGQLTAGRTRMGKAGGAPMDWTVPDEGVLTFIDTLAIPKTSENVENAHTFINFLLKPEIMALEMEGMYYDTLNEAARAELDPEVAKQFEVREDANLVLSTDLDQQVRTKMDELWTEVKLS
jgi:spermidine/putrescine transport system substrate-binding protein